MTLAYYRMLAEPQLVALLKTYASTTQERLQSGFVPQMSFGGASAFRQSESIVHVRTQLDLILSVLHGLNPTKYPDEPRNRTTVVAAVNDEDTFMRPPSV